jgi:4,5-DOPA dioxygenase extradiol
MPSTPDRVPALFVGHGSPMNAIEDNRWSRALRELATQLERPRAVLAVSAHWFVEGTRVTGHARPPTIHDFGGFPRGLHEIEYPAPGDPQLAERVRSLLGGDRVALDDRRGLDHGVWSVLIHLYPQADVPVVQVSLDERLTPREHYLLARPLRHLRDEGVLLLASGNVTHNLGYAMRQRAQGDDSTPSWASRFDEAVKRACATRDGDALARLLETEDGRMAQPSPDHYLPILYAAAAADERDEVSFPIEGFDWGSLSMRSVLFRSQANRTP